MRQFSFFTLLYFSKRLRVSKQLQQNTADFTQMIQESLMNMKIIQIYTAEEKNINQFKNLQQRYISGYIKEIKFRITREQIDAYSQYFIFLIIIWFGGYLAHNDVITTSQLLAFFTGIVVLVEPVIILTKIYAETFKVTASIERINFLLNYESKHIFYPIKITWNLKQFRLKMLIFLTLGPLNRCCPI